MFWRARREGLCTTATNRTLESGLQLSHQPCRPYTHHQATSGAGGTERYADMAGLHFTADTVPKVDYRHRQLAASSSLMEGSTCRLLQLSTASWTSSEPSFLRRAPWTIGLCPLTPLARRILPFRPCPAGLLVEADRQTSLAKHVCCCGCVAFVSACRCLCRAWRVTLRARIQG